MERWAASIRYDDPHPSAVWLTPSNREEAHAETQLHQSLPSVSNGFQITRTRKGVQALKSLEETQIQPFPQHEWWISPVKEELRVRLCVFMCSAETRPSICNKVSVLFQLGAQWLIFCNKKNIYCVSVCNFVIFFLILPYPLLQMNLY